MLTYKLKPKVVSLLIIALSVAGYSFSAGASINLSNLRDSESVQITNLQDVDFGTVIPGNSNLRDTDPICVYNSSDKNYQITASGLHDSGKNFFMADGSNTIRYRVRWGQSSGRFKTLNAGQRKKFSGASKTLLCGGSTNARLRIVIRSTWLNNPIPPAGTYTDTLSILLEPE